MMIMTVISRNKASPFLIELCKHVKGRRCFLEKRTGGRPEKKWSTTRD
jgi:hypothetical protein